MPTYEYRVQPAPKRGIKVNGAKTTEDRFAQALQAAMNQMGAQGWEFVRSDTLPCEERQGLTGRATTYQTVLVYRRAVEAAAESLTPRIMIAAPVATPVVRLPDTDIPAAPPVGPADPRVAAE